MSDFSTASFWNFIACLYLERHNFKIAATNAIDGGVFVVPGLTSVYRSKILKPQTFRDAFITEYILFGLIGSLNADDDNFLTRWVVNHGYEIKIQYTEGACIETTLGEYPKFRSDCLKWLQTTSCFNYDDWRHSLSTALEALYPARHPTVLTAPRPLVLLSSIQPLHLVGQDHDFTPYFHTILSHHQRGQEYLW